MKIIYRFNGGTISEVEVDEELGLSIEAMEREYQSYERKMRRWAPIRLDESIYEGEWFEDNNTPSKHYDLEQEHNKVHCRFEGKRDYYFDEEENYEKENKSRKYL